MDLAPWLGANRSDTRGIARICNDAMGPKTRSYVPHSVKHCISTSAEKLFPVVREVRVLTCAPMLAPKDLRTVIGTLVQVLRKCL